jgi:hypothetical protein
MKSSKLGVSCGIFRWSLLVSWCLVNFGAPLRPRRTWKWQLSKALQNADASSVPGSFGTFNGIILPIDFHISQKGWNHQQIYIYIVIFIEIMVYRDFTTRRHCCLNMFLSVLYWPGSSRIIEVWATHPRNQSADIVVPRLQTDHGFSWGHQVDWLRPFSEASSGLPLWTACRIWLVPWVELQSWKLSCFMTHII